MPEFSVNTCGTDYFRKVHKLGVIVGAAGQDINVAPVRSHRGAIGTEDIHVD
jgi:hypothetical protein